MELACNSQNFPSCRAAWKAALGLGDDVAGEAKREAPAQAELRPTALPPNAKRQTPNGERQTQQE
jgi:hypothetical protein